MTSIQLGHRGYHQATADGSQYCRGDKETPSLTPVSDGVIEDAKYGDKQTDQTILQGILESMENDHKIRTRGYSEEGGRRKHQKVPSFSSLFSRAPLLPVPI